MLTAGLVVAAVFAGLAGAWSPCGFSMVESIAPSACSGRVRGTLAAALAFAAGALAGGVATFGGLAVAGRHLGLGGGLAVALALGLAVAAAAGDLAGRRIVPQVRRQVPESWRRVLPLPVASGLYGVLLGLGFTTFVLSFTTYALAAVCLAVGSPALGAAVGAAFAAGRAVPVLLLSPCVERPTGARVAAAMAERPDVLRMLRAAAAVALVAGAAAGGFDGAAALAAAVALPARASRFALNATDPSAADGVVAWQAPGAGGRILRDGRTDELPGDSPAVGGGLVAWRSSGRIEVARVTDLTVRASIEAPAADEVAVSEDWLAWRQSDGTGGWQLLVTAPGGGIAPRVVFSSRHHVGRPAVAGGILVFHLARARSSRIVEIDLVSGKQRVLAAPAGTQFLQPSVHGNVLAMVRATARRQELVLKSRKGRAERRAWSTEPTARRDAGYEPGKGPHRAGYRKGRPRRLWRRPSPGYVATLWSTAITDDTAYVTRLVHRGGVAVAEILAVPLPSPARRRRGEKWVRT